MRARCAKLYVETGQVGRWIVTAAEAAGPGCLTPPATNDVLLSELLDLPARPHTAVHRNCWPQDRPESRPLCRHVTPTRSICRATGVSSSHAALRGDNHVPAVCRNSSRRPPPQKALGGTKTVGLGGVEKVEVQLPRLVDGRSECARLRRPSRAQLPSAQGKSGYGQFAPAQAGPFHPDSSSPSQPDAVRPRRRRQRLAGGFARRYSPNYG